MMRLSQFFRNEASKPQKTANCVKALKSSFRIQVFLIISEDEANSGQNSAGGCSFVIFFPPLKLQNFKIPALNVKLQSHECNLCSLSPKWCACCGKCWRKPSAAYVM